MSAFDEEDEPPYETSSCSCNPKLDLLVMVGLLALIGIGVVIGQLLKKL